VFTAIPTLQHHSPSSLLQSDEAEARKWPVF